MAPLAPHWSSSYAKTGGVELWKPLQCADSQQAVPPSPVPRKPHSDVHYDGGGRTNPEMTWVTFSRTITTMTELNSLKFVSCCLSLILFVVAYFNSRLILAYAMKL